jgi:hypothetical protein
MLTIQGGPRDRFCDGVSRRDFLKIGGLAMGGLGLTDVLAAEARAAAGKRPSSSHKAVIMIFLAGGPPHQDMFDMKPDQPAEIRGEFKPISTNLPGFQICEHMPRLAKMADKYAVIRSLVGARDEHSSHLCYSGYTFAEHRQGHWPAMGSVVSKLQGPVDPTVAPFVSLSQKMGHAPWANPGEAGFLGLAHNPFVPHGQVAADMALKDISLSRLQNRRALLGSVDRFRREADTLVSGTDAITQRALEMLTSNKVLQAMDVEREDPKIREKYGKGSLKNVDDGGPMWNDGLLIARRLVETGVRCVTIGYGRWDYHGNNFGQCRERLPILDQGVSALIQDLHDRGLDKDVSVVVWGDFGRTPRVNKDGGRDHWAPVSCALLAGGGMRTGQVIGSTTPDAGYADQRPIHYKEVMATLYHNMGINLESTPVPGADERPLYLLPEYAPIEELV